MKNNKVLPAASELADELRTLVAETKTMLADSFAERSSEAFAALSERLDATQERVTELYEEARKKVVAGARCTDAAIRENPYQSLAVAVGVGVIVGALIARRR